MITNGWQQHVGLLSVINTISIPTWETN